MMSNSYSNVTRIVQKLKPSSSNRFSKEWNSLWLSVFGWKISKKYKTICMSVKSCWTNTWESQVLNMSGCSAWRIFRLSSQKSHECGKSRILLKLLYQIFEHWKVWSYFWFVSIEFTSLYPYIVSSWDCFHKRQ